MFVKINSFNMKKIILNLIKQNLIIKVIKMIKKIAN